MLDQGKVTYWLLGLGLAVSVVVVTEGYVIVHFIAKFW